MDLVESVEILEGDQIHEQGFRRSPFETSVDVRVRLDSGLEVIGRIQALSRVFLESFTII